MSSDDDTSLSDSDESSISSLGHLSPFERLRTLLFRLMDDIDYRKVTDLYEAMERLEEIAGAVSDD